MKLINYILKRSRSDIYISSGLMSKDKIKKYLNFFKKNKRVKIGYTKLSYKEEHMNLEQLKNLSFIFKNKLAYCHHLKDEIAILIVNAISNIDTFFYIKGNNENIKHPDEHHAIRLNKVNKIVSDINKVKKLWEINQISFMEITLKIKNYEKKTAIVIGGSKYRSRYC